MKNVLFALVATCVAGLASAVTVDWDAITWKNVGTGTSREWSIASNSEAIGYTGNADFALRVTYAGTTGDTIGNVAKAYLQITAGETMYNIQGGPGWNDVWVVDGYESSSTNYTVNNSVALPANTKVDLSFAVVYDHSEKQLDAYATLNGTTALVGQITNLNFTDWVTFGTNTDWDNRKLTGVFVEEGFSYSVDYTNNIAPMPEPTVLALLALGVAGIALKRKVA